MGQVCSGAKEESPKGGPLHVPSQSDPENYVDPSPEPGHPNDAKPEDGDSVNDTPKEEPQDPDTEGRKLVEELQRRKQRELWIVNGAARGMVAVRSTRGSTGYYDQGFAGLLAQHLEQTTSFPDKLPLVLPAQAPLKPTEATEEDTTTTATSTGGDAAISASSSSSPSKDKPATPTNAKKSTFFDRLAQPAWEGMELVVEDASSKLRGREASAAASGDPHKLMDALAESLLDGPYTVLPAKQQLFAGVKPMVENLL